MNIKYFLIIIIIFSQVTLAIEILSCSSSRDQWKCEIGKDCVCLLSENCTNGNLLIYQEDIRSLICAPSIDGNIVKIDIIECGAVYYKNLIVRADCDKEVSQEKTITIIPRTETTTTTVATTTIPQTTVTTVLSCGVKGQYCGQGRMPCCEGLTCCSDLVCREKCEEEGTKIDIWLIVIGAISVLIVIGILFFVGSIL